MLIYGDQPSTLGDIKEELLARLQRDHDDETVSVNEKSRALLEDDIFLDMLIQLKDCPISSAPLEYDNLIKEICSLGCIKATVIKDMITRRRAENETRELGLKQVREPSDPALIKPAREILEMGNPIDEYLEYVSGKVYGKSKQARATLLSSYSTYMSVDDRLHSDACGSAQSGKSATTTSFLETFPEENVIVTSEASPKSIYYLAQNDPERLKDAIVYIDDARPEHIPLLKTFRNEGNVTPRNMSVADGEYIELSVKYRPVVLASSVTPLRDLEQQAMSRTFLISYPDSSEDEEKMVRKAIRKQARSERCLIGTRTTKSRY